MKKAIVLLSGGLDSAVTFYLAQKDHKAVALIFNYGQKAAKELDSAKRLVFKTGCESFLVNMSFPWKGSSLVDPEKNIPLGQLTAGSHIPNTYVPARNIIFLSYAVSLAESIGAEKVFIGAHQLDYSNYPDCRGEFFESFQDVISKGTKSGVEADPVKIEAPLLNKTKLDIVRLGKSLGVPFEDTWSCYKGGQMPCGECESCQFRMEAFNKLGEEDPLLAKKETS